ncbi:MAG: alpha/beta hydrolase [Salaquimonas sp.]|jgi:acetyl esterase/lipase|nr:alpha/beta hydrolase [Salaquimonas sp.]
MIDRRKFVAGAAAILAGLTLPLVGIRPAQAKTFRGVSYGASKLDIYTPDADNAPVIVYVHGGAWRLGSRSEGRAVADSFTARGYIVVSIDYSLTASAERQAREVAQAVAWVHGNISKYGGNPDRIALMGHSAGCHLASLAALSGLAPGVKALVANDTGAYDIQYLADIHGGHLPILYAALNKPAKWRNWSPISYAAGANGIPVLVAWSGAEFRRKVSTRFADALAAAGHPVTRFAGNGYSHVSIRGGMGKTGDPLNTAIANFLAANL